MATSNFKYQKGFPLFASEAFEIAENEDGERVYIDFDQWLFEECERRVEDFNAGLRFYRLSLEGGYYCGVQTLLHRASDTTELSEDYTPEEWRDRRREAKEYPYLYGDEFGLPYARQKAAEARERRRAEEFCRTVLHDEFGFDEYFIAARFSNGETIYTKAA